MPGPGGVSFISNFVSGYTGTMAKLKEEKERNIQSLMRVAEHHYKVAHDPNAIPEIQENAERSYTETLDAVSKEENRKISGLSDVLKSVFKIGKGPKPTQGGATIPRELWDMDRQAAAAAAEQAPEERAGYDPNVNVGAGGGESGLFKFQKAWEGRNMPPEETDPYAGLNKIAQNNLRIQSEEDALELKSREQVAEAEYDRKVRFEKFESGMTQEERENNLSMYRSSEAYNLDAPRERAEKENAIMQGWNYSPRSNYQKVMKKDPATGEAYYQYVDVNDPSIQEERFPVVGSASYTNDVTTIMNETGGTWQEAEQIYAQRQAQAGQIKTRKDQLSIQNSEALLAGREQVNTLRAMKEQGAFGAKEARDLYELAQRIAESKLKSRYDYRIMSNEEQSALKTKYIREEIEGVPGIRPGFGLTLEELIEMQTGKEGETEAEAAEKWRESVRKNKGAAGAPASGRPRAD